MLRIQGGSIHKVLSTVPGLEWVHVVVVLSLSHVWLFATPWAVAYQAPLSTGFLRQEYLSGLPFPSPGDLLNPGIQPASPALAGGFFTTEPPGKPECLLIGSFCYICYFEWRRFRSRCGERWVSVICTDRNYRTFILLIACWRKMFFPSLFFSPTSSYNPPLGLHYQDRFSLHCSSHSNPPLI